MNAKTKHNIKKIIMSGAFGFGIGTGAGLAVSIGASTSVLLGFGVAVASGFLVSHFMSVCRSRDFKPKACIAGALVGAVATFNIIDGCNPRTLECEPTQQNEIAPKREALKAQNYIVK
jgi:hypothetical protein